MPKITPFETSSNNKKYLIEVIDVFSGNVFAQFLAVGDVYEMNNRLKLEERVKQEAMDHFKNIGEDEIEYDYEIIHLYDDEVLNLTEGK